MKTYPNSPPNIKFKTSDGSKIYEVYVQNLGNNIYYFDRHILDNFDMKKDYIFEVKSSDKRNTTLKSVNINLGNKNLGLNSNKYEVYTEGELLKFSFKTYVGEPIIELKELNWGRIPYDLGYIYGKIVYKEIINGVSKSALENPILSFQSTDGTLKKEVYVDYIGNNTYYFDRHIFDSFDKTKEYVFKVKSGDIRNTYNKEKTINLGTRKLCTVNGYKVMTKENKIYFEKDISKGIDVSQYNGDIDWRNIKLSGIDFAIIRIGFRGYGSGKIVFDSKFKENSEKANINKIQIGVYFVTQAINYNEGKEEANQVLAKIKECNVKITYPIVVDIEWAGGEEGYQGRADYISVAQRTEAARGFCETIKNAGYTPMIYANKYWLMTYLDMSKLSSYEVWLAHYVSGAPTKTSDYKGKYSIWQYTSSGSVSGVNGNVDLDISYKNY